MKFGISNISRDNEFSPFALKVLKDGKILAQDETPEQMIERVADVALIELEDSRTSQHEIRRFRDNIATLLTEKKFVPSSPILTNAGRYSDRPLSACAVPPINLRDNLSKIKQMVDSYHLQGMGTGFNLDDLDDPVTMLKHLNDIAVEGSKSGREDRPVGNMGVLTIYHPKILEFIKAKVARDRDWKFNISINIDDQFMEAVFLQKDVRLLDGTIINAEHLFEEIATAARECGDPGLVFIGRMNRDNPTPMLGEYIATAPCGEVGLAAGETCQFGSINLGRMVHFDRHGAAQVDYSALRDVTHLIIRYLDDALDFSLPRYSMAKSASIMSSKRKIGIGVCGFADLLILLGIPYASSEAKALAEDIMSFVNFCSKEASVKLAKDKGAFLHFALSQHVSAPSFIQRRYSTASTRTVASEDWEKLDQEVKSVGLRNAVTTALPPTGRSSLVFDCSQQIEPIFRLTTFGREVRDDFEYLIRNNHPDRAATLLGTAKDLGHCRDLDIAPALKELFKTATEIAPLDHLEMAAQFQKHTDESVSKTINLPADATVKNVVEIYKLAYISQLKGITIYRDGSHLHQPVTLSK